MGDGCGFWYCLYSNCRKLFCFCLLRLVGSFFVEDVLREVRLFEVFLHEQLSISR